MPFTDTTDNIASQLTDKGRSLSTRTAIEGLSFQFSTWAIGRDGYDISNPVKVLAIDPADIALVDQIYPTALTRQTIVGGDFEFPTNRSVSVTLRVPRETLAANYGIGEIGLWVKIIDSPIPSEINTEHLFSISHTPIQAIPYNQAKVWRVIVNF